MTTTDAILGAVLGRDLPKCQSHNRTWRPPEPLWEDVYEIWKFDLKTGLWEEQLMRCYYCGRLIDDISGAHLEHKTPLVYGGGNELSNLCLACAHCNLQKGKRSEAEYLTLIILAEQEAGHPIYGEIINPTHGVRVI
jgi:5-methylcytosine-specific restriction endonuclease McrA